MALHLIKLCVGVDSIEELADWQTRRLRELKRRKKPLELRHVTRMTPKRKDELLAGGSLYWIIRGYTAVRQELIDLRPAVKDGIPSCAIVYAPPLIPVARRAHRPFQGWRYLKGKEAPKDLPKGAINLPQELQRTLSELGLL